MAEGFTIRQTNDRIIATIDGLPAGGQAGARPFIIPVFIPMSGCPHRCAFCNQTAITGVKSHAISPSAVTHAIDTFLPFVRDRGRSVQIAFYGGNFLGLPEQHLHDLLAIATAHVTRGDVASIRFSTRPDTITENRLAAIRDFPVHTIELGVQSMDDRVLARANRGHNAQCTLNAARMVVSAGYALGLQMMTGLPGDTPRRAIQTARKLVALAPDFVRIYPTLVLRQSRLAETFRSGAFIPASLDETIALVSRLLLVFTAAHIPVIRMGLQADEALAAPGAILAGPYHPALGERVHSHLFYRLAKATLARAPRGFHAATIRVHPRHLSRMIGAGRENLSRLKTHFHLENLSVQADTGVTPHHLEVDIAPSPIALK
jgi:histone acetyltransferase (RNA polymerase elongator complex component)